MRSEFIELELALIQAARLVQEAARPEEKTFVHCAATALGEKLPKDKKMLAVVRQTQESVVWP